MSSSMNKLDEQLGEHFGRTTLKTKASDGPYLYKMLIDPFCERFLLDHISFI